MDNYEQLQRELHATKQKLAEANRRFDEAMKTIHLQGQIIKAIKADGDDDLTFLARFPAVAAE